jgi:hypothetical protein
MKWTGQNKATGSVASRSPSVRSTTSARCAGWHDTYLPLRYSGTTSSLRHHQIAEGNSTSNFTPGLKELEVTTPRGKLGRSFIEPLRRSVLRFDERRFAR